MRVSGAIPERVVVAYEDALGNPVDVSSTNALPTTGGGGGGGGNSAAGPTGSPVPTDADYIGFNNGGNLVGVSATNPLPVNIGAVGTLGVTDPDVQFLLLRLLSYLNAPYGYDKSLGRYRNTVVVESGTVTTVTTVTTVSTVTTCSTVTNLSQIDTLQGRLLVLGQNAAAWQSSVRSRIT